MTITQFETRWTQDYAIGQEELRRREYEAMRWLGIDRSVRGLRPGRGRMPGRSRGMGAGQARQ